MTAQLLMKYELGIKRHAEFLMSEYRRFVRTAGDDQWDFQKSIQAYRDALESLKQNGLIRNYNLETGEEEGKL